MVISTTSWNNEYQVRRKLDGMGINNQEAIDNLPRFDTRGLNLSQADDRAKDALSDFNREYGVKLSYVDNSLSNLENIIGEVPGRSAGINLQETYDKLIKSHLLERVLYPSKIGSNTVESYLIVSDKLFSTDDVKNNDVIKFFAKLSSYSGIDQFLLPEISKRSDINENGSSRLYLYGGYKVLKFLDEKKSKFEISKFLEAQHEAGERLRHLANGSRAKVIESYGNGSPDGTVVSGSFPNLDEDPEYKVVSEEVRGWLHDPNIKGHHVYRSTGLNIDYKKLTDEDLMHNDPQKIFDKYLDLTMPVPDQERIRSSNWFWVPEEKALVHGPTNTNDKVRELIEGDLRLFLNLDTYGNADDKKAPDVTIRTFREEEDAHLLDSRITS
jgi:hypothetical protein